MNSVYYVVPPTITIVPVQQPLNIVQVVQNQNGGNITLVAVPLQTIAPASSASSSGSVLGPAASTTFSNNLTIQYGNLPGEVTGKATGDLQKTSSPGPPTIPFHVSNDTAKNTRDKIRRATKKTKSAVVERSIEAEGALPTPKLDAQLEMSKSNNINGTESNQIPFISGALYSSNQYGLPNQCPVCGIAYASPKSLKTHMGSSHSAKTSFKCNFCPRIFKTSFHRASHESKSHLDGRSGTLECTICGKVLDTQRLLKSHLMIHSEERPHQCSFCQKTYKTLFDLNVHEKSVHAEKRSFYECRHCSKRYSLLTSLWCHEESHRVIKVKLPVAKNYPCSFCNMRYRNALQLERHERFHTDEKPYKCRRCGDSFSHLLALRNHECDHRSPRDFLCVFCGKRFRLRNTVLKHEQTHSKEKPFQCSLCPKRFRSKPYLSRHVVVTHAENKPFVCEVCGRGFVIEYEMKVHERIHSDKRPFTCQICGDGFRKSQTLSQHMMLHTGEKPYKCRYCSEVFHSTCRRWTHEKIHLKEES